MNYWKVILATVVIFGAGVVTGGLLVNFVQHGHSPARRNAGEPHRDAGQDLPMPRAEMMNKQFIQQLDEALKLSPDQRKSIEGILAEGQQRNRELWKLVSPQMRMVMQDVNQRIRHNLNPEQQKQFEKLMKQLRPQHKSSGTNAMSVTLPSSNSITPATNVVLTNAPAL